MEYHRYSNCIYHRENSRRGSSGCGIGNCTYFFSKFMVRYDIQLLNLELTVCKYDPDIIGITESWCTPSVSDSELQLINYDLFRCDRDTDNK